MRIDATETRTAAGLVFLAAVVIYVNTLWNGFAYDDTWIVATNARVHQLADQRLIWLTPYWPTFGEALGLYRPLAIFLFALQWAVADGAAWVFHAGNVLLHGVASVLVLLLLRRLTSATGALAGALVFAVHPVHTEGVANVVGQAELLAAIGVLSACLIHVSRDGVRVSLARALVLSAIFLLAMFAKEGAIILPFLIVLVDVAAGKASLHPRRMLAYAREIARIVVAFGIIVAGYLLLRGYVLGSITGTDVAPSYPFLYGTHRILNAFRAWPEYVRLLFFPADLSADYSPGVILPVEAVSPLVVLGAGLLLLTVALAGMTERHPAAGFGAGWFLIAILPVSNLLYTIGVVLAERTLYLPSVAVSAYVAYACVALEREHGRVPRYAWAALGVVLLAGSYRVVVRNPDWMSTSTIMEAILRDHPESYRAQWSAAVRAAGAGDTAQAEEHWAFAYGLYKRDSQMLTELGAFNLQMRRYPLAARLLEDARAMHPGVTRTEQFLAVAHLNARNYDQALAAVDRSIRLIGPSAYLFEMRARALMGMGRPAEAVPVWRSAIRQPNGDAWMQWLMLGRALAAAGQRAEALGALDSAARRAGGNPAAMAEVTKARAVVSP